MTDDPLDRRPVDSIPEAVQWHEGMLLSPQHLQQEAWRQEAVQNYLARAASPYLWGVRRMRVDEGLIGSGVFRLTQVEVLMPDGLIVSLATDDPANIEIDLGAMDMDLAQDPVAIHLTVPRRSARSAAPGALRRYVSVNAPAVVDENTGDGELFIPRLRPVIDLDVTRSPLERPSSAYVSCPIARVGAVEGRIQLLKDDYSYPMLEVTPGSPLHDAGLAVARDLRDKSAGVAERLRGGRERDGVEAIENLAALRGMTAVLPRLETMLATGVTHPYDLFLTLCDIAGLVAPIDIELVPINTPAYVHNDPLPAFRTIAGIIRRAVKSLQRPFREIAFTQEDGAVYSLDMRERPISGMLVVCLYSGSGQSVEDTAQWIDAAAIASESAMNDVQRRRIRGAPRRVVDGVRELELTTPRGGVLIAIEADRDFVTNADHLHILHPDGPGQAGQPSRIVLISATEQPARSAGGSQRRTAPSASQPPPPPRGDRPRTATPPPPPRSPRGRRE
jgi:type VI secretion system protein ImpJ